MRIVKRSLESISRVNFDTNYDICTSKFTPSQSNGFRKTCSDIQFYFKFSYTIETQKLGIFRLSNRRLLRLELMTKLHNQGLSSREICDYFNEKNIKTVQTNNPYTPKLIWITLQKKCKKRLQRIRRDRISRIKEGIYVNKEG